MSYQMLGIAGSKVLGCKKNFFILLRFIINKITHTESFKPGLFNDI